MKSDTDTAAEERRLWADFYDATWRALQIMRTEGTGRAVLERVDLEQELASSALARIKEIRGLARTRR